jgi:hypothetical protein
VTQTTEWPYCPTPMVWQDCPYPFWYHEGTTPRHGEWVPEHDCDADWSRRTWTDVPLDCGNER